MARGCSQLQRNKMSWFDENGISEDIARQLIRIKVTTDDNQIVEKDVRADVVIDYENLEHQLEETPASFAFYAMLLAESKKQVATIERVIKVRKGQITKELLRVAKEDNVKTRGTDIEALIDADPRVLELEVKLVSAERTMSKLYAVVDAIRMKSEHLRSLAGFKKQEMRDTDLQK